MSWVAVGVAAAGATVSYMENDRQNREARKREERTRRENAAQTEVSWARKDGKGTINPIEMAPIGKSNLGAGLQGGLSGYMMGSSINSGMAAKPEVPADSGAAMGGVGGPSYADKLGQSTQAFQTEMAPKMAAMNANPNPMAGGTTMDWNALGQQTGNQPNMFGAQKPDFMSYNQGAKKPTFWGP